MGQYLIRFVCNGLYRAQLMWLHFLLMVSADGVSERVDFGVSPKTALFLEGITLRLYCTQASTDDIEIRSSTQLIVEGSNIVDGFTEIYDFEKVTSTTCVLVIKNLTRNKSGGYSCRKGDETKFVSVHVLYSPSSQSPLCTSNYDSLVIVNDLPLDHINFTCATEQGYPPVLVQLHIFEPNSTNNITSIQNICTTHNQHPNSRLLSCRIDDSLENATFVCDVSQQFPPEYNSSYRRSCSFGPVHFPPKFSISITPKDVRVNEGANVTLTCTTNVTGVEIKWIYIPENWKYNESESEYSSQLEIYNVEQQPLSQIIVQCIGTYDRRRVRANATITVNQNGQVPIVTVVICCSFSLLFITFLLGVYAWKNKMHDLKSNMHTSRQTAHNNEGASFEANELAGAFNKNNANSKSLESGDENESEDNSDMCDNPVYESASQDADTAESR